MSDKKAPEISKQETGKILSKNTLYNVWKDAVISKLIANWIWYIVPFMATLIFSYFKKEEIYSSLKSLMFLDIKLYVLIIFLVLSLIIRKIYFKFSTKQKKHIKHFQSQQIGNYKFPDLNNVLLTTVITLPKYYESILGLNELDLLTCFRMFISRFNMGIGWDHAGDEDGFLYYQLGPILMSYDLCEKVASLENNQAGNINSYDIQTSQNGLKFFAFLESFDRIENYKKYEIEIVERNTKIEKAMNSK
jgi:hypothetical protein